MQTKNEKIAFWVLSILMNQVLCKENVIDVLKGVVLSEPLI